MEPSLSFSSIPSQIPQEYLTITEIKNTTVLAKTPQNQLEAVPLHNINLYNRPIKPEEVQSGDVVVVKSINSNRIFELYLESAEILSVDSNSICMLLQGNQSQKLNRKQLLNYSENIHVGEIVRVFKRKDEILKIIFKSQFIVDVLKWEYGIGGNMRDGRVEEIQMMSGNRLGLKAEDNIEKELDRYLNRLSLAPDRNYDIPPTRGPEQVFLQDEMRSHPSTYSQTQVHNMDKSSLNYSPNILIQQPHTLHKLPIDPRANLIPPAQPQGMLSSPIQPRIPGSPYSSPPLSTQITQSIPRNPMQPPYSPYTQIHQPITNPSQSRNPGYSYDYTSQKDDRVPQTIPATHIQYPGYSQMHQYGMSSYQGEDNKYSHQVHQYEKQPEANQHTYYSQGPQYPKPPQDLLNHYSTADSMYTTQPQVSPYPTPPQGSQYPTPPQGSQYPSQAQGSKHSYQSEEFKYPSQPKGSQYHPHPQGLGYPYQPQRSQHSYESEEFKYPSQPQGHQYPLQPQGPQYPSQPQGPQYPQYPKQPNYPQQSPSQSYQIQQAPLYHLPPNPALKDHSNYSIPQISSPILQSPIQPHPFSQGRPSSSEQLLDPPLIQHQFHPGSPSSSEQLFDPFPPQNMPSSKKSRKNPTSRPKQQPNPPPSISQPKIYSYSPKQPISTLSETNSDQAQRKRQNFATFSSYRDMSYSADSYYLALGIGYLENLCRKSTDASMICIFINYLKEQTRTFNHRKILCNSSEFIRALDSLASSSNRFQMLKSLLENSDFLKDYAKILRFLTANIIETQGCDAHLLRQVELDGAVTDPSLRCLADALNILVIFHCLNPPKLFQKGAVNYDLVIHLISKQEEDGTRYSLLYFSYQDEEDLGIKAEDKQFRCMGCHALPHELHFPQGRHKCCCVCSGKQVLKSHKTCTSCRAPFNHSLEHYLLNNLFSCQECGVSDYLQNLRVCEESDRILCISCIDKVTYSSTASYNTPDSRVPQREERPARTLQDTQDCIYCEQSLASSNFTEKLSCDCICCEECYENLKDSGFQACIFCNTPLDPNSSNCILCNKLFPKQQEIVLECKHTYCPSCAEKTIGSQLETLQPTILCGTCKAPVAEEKYANIAGQALLNFYKQQIRYQRPCRLCSHDLSQNCVELSCGHAFDKDCLEACFMHRMDRNEELRCPEMCSKEIQCSELKQVLSKEYIGKLVGKRYKNLIVKSFTKCPKCNTKYSKDKVAGNVACRVCHLKYCGECDMPQQGNGNNHAQTCLFY